MAIKIALAGNPNCGKTTLFNDLTGSNQYVGNWPGVTVEKKEGKLKGHKDAVLQDLPGIYSLSPYSLEEVVSRNYLVEEKPDAILNIVDGTNIERNLYLTTQLVELGLPMVIAVNMMDLVKKSGDKIDMDKLGKSLGCEVVAVSALKGDGGAEVAEKAIELAKEHRRGELPHVFTGSVEHAIAHIEESIQDIVPQKEALRWFAIKVFERDAKVIERLKLDPALVEHIEKHIKDCEKELDDDAESIVTNQRYEYIKKLVADAVVKQPRKDNLSLSDKIDRIVTNRILGLPIFVAVIWFMYYVSVTTVGGWLTDWANDGVFGDGWFLAWTKGPKGDRGAWEDASGDFAAAQTRIVTFGNALVGEGAASWKEVEEEVEEAAEETAEAPAEAAAEAAEDAADEAEAEAEEEEAPEVDEENVGDYELAVSDEAAAGALTRVFRIEDEESGEVTNYPEALDEYLSANHTEEEFEALTREDILALFQGEPTEELDGITLVKVAENEDGELAESDAEDAEPALKEAGAGDDGEDVYYPLSGFIADYDTYKEALEVEEPDPKDYGVWIPGLPPLFEALFEKLGIPEESVAHSIVFDVILGGVGTILGFVPQIVIVFLFLAFLEDCGYMARVAFIMDRIFHRFGLSGKSFIPMLVGMGCGVPAVMATRTIEAQRDRRMTIMLGTYIPCGAKAAIIAMFVPAFFSSSAWVATAMYFAGIAVIVLGGIVLKKFRAFAGDPAPFVMELPAYHAPTVSGILIHTWERAKAYIIKAGTIIFAACTVIWVLMTFDWAFNYVDLQESILADIGNAIKWLFAPLGFGNSWEAGVASVTAELAKEEAPATLAMLAESQDAVGGTLPHLRALFTVLNGAGLGTLAALSFMLFNLFNPPCLVAIATAFREMGSAKWGWICMGFQFLVGYCLALVVYQIGALCVAGSFGFWTVVAFALVLALLYLLFRPMPKEAK